MNRIFKPYKTLLIAAILILSTAACEDQLKEEPFDQLDPNLVLNTEEGLESLLISAYGNMQWHRFPLIQVHYLEEGPSDLFFETGGGQARDASRLQEFSFDPEHPYIGAVYDRLWNAIRDVNLFLATQENVEYEKADKNVRIGEARFIRAFEYYWLTKFFGEVPLVTSPDDELYPAKASMEVLNSFIETELQAAGSVLPVDQPEYNRITKGAALSILTKFYLNTKQWDKCATTARQVMDLGVYELYPSYVDMFKPDNEINSEFIFVMPCSRIGGGLGTEWTSLSLPPKYPIDGPNFAAQFRYYDSFVNSFAPEDTRRDLFVTQYTDTDGKDVQLLGNDNSRSLKFRDDARVGADQENDFPVVRYADILLSRAEALNEMDGPSDEAIDLINQVRARAGEDMTLLSAGDFTKETLREELLQERAWEFYSESKRRSDLLRHGVFISRAQDRGKPAKDYQKLYPIPQGEINANKNLVQNDGY